MPRARQAQGRPGTRVIPEAWEAGHAVVAGKTMTASCRIRPTATAPAKINPDLSYTPADAPAVIYEGACRVQVLNLTGAQNTRLFGDEHQTDVGYLLTIGYDADGVTPGCLVEVTESNDPNLGGNLRLVVTRVDMGSLRFERDVYCVDIRHQV